MAEDGASAIKTRSWIVALAVTEGDVAEAEAAIDRLAAALADKRLVIRDVWLLRMQALLARAHGDEASYRENRDRYRALATMAEAMP